MTPADQRAFDAAFDAAKQAGKATDAAHRAGANAIRRAARKRGEQVIVATSPSAPRKPKRRRKRWACIHGRLVG